MDAQEWWWLYDAHRPRDPETDYAGSLTEDDVERLSNLAKEYGLSRHG